MCPHCVETGARKGVEFEGEKEGEKEGLSLLSDPISSVVLEKKKTDLQKETPKSPKRGKAREYTGCFETAWKAYGRKDQKFEAFTVWMLRAGEEGGELILLTKVLSALEWQSGPWSEEGWKFAPYFERYLKRRKWEDERPPSPGPRVPEKVQQSRDAWAEVLGERKVAR